MKYKCRYIFHMLTKKFYSGNKSPRVQVLPDKLFTKNSCRIYKIFLDQGYYENGDNQKLGWVCCQNGMHIIKDDEDKLHATFTPWILIDSQMIPSSTIYKKHVTH